MVRPLVYDPQLIDENLVEIHLLASIGPGVHEAFGFDRRHN